MAGCIQCIAIFTIGIFTVLPTTLGEDFLECYLCSASGVSTNDGPCSNDVSALAPTDRVMCNIATHECVVFYQYLAVDTSTINAMTRRCEQRGVYSNRCVKDAHFNTCYSVCDTDLCNHETDLLNKYTTTKAPSGSVLPTTLGDELLECYLCSESGLSTNDGPCSNDVNALAPTDRVMCKITTHECVVFYQYLAVDTSTINSMTRRCEQRGVYSNRCVKDAHFNTCYSVCDTDLCNHETDLINKYTTTTKPSGSGINSASRVQVSWLLLLGAIMSMYAAPIIDRLSN